VKTARLWVLALVCPVLAAAEATEGSLAGRPLAQALEVLQARGVKVIFSTKLVRAEMRVGREPHATRPAELLHELLHPHGLTARAGPEDSWLVVKAPPAPAPPPAADPQPTPAPPAKRPGLAAGRAAAIQRIHAASGYAEGRAPTPQVLGAAAVHGYTVAFWVSAGIFAAGALIVGGMMRSIHVEPETLPAPMTESKPVLART